MIRDANMHAVAILAARNETTADGKLLTAAPRMREALKKIEAEVSGMVHAFPHWEEHLAEIRGALLAAGGAGSSQSHPNSSEIGIRTREQFDAARREVKP